MTHGYITSEKGGRRRENGEEHAGKIVMIYMLVKKKKKERRGKSSSSRDQRGRGTKGEACQGQLGCHISGVKKEGRRIGRGKKGGETTTLGQMGAMRTGNMQGRSKKV